MQTVRQLLETHTGGTVTIAPDATVLDALRLMAERNVGSVVVMDGERIAGIVTERDYARKVVLEGRQSSDTPVRDVMTTGVTCVTPDRTVAGCMSLMTDGHFRHLPVLENERLIGIISIGDLVRSTIDDQKRTIDELTHYING